MNKTQLRKKKISFFTENKYESQAPIELAKRGYKIKINDYDEDTDLIVSMGIRSSFILFEKMSNESRFKKKFNGKIIHNVLDLPSWRLGTNMWKKYYGNYRKLLDTAHHLLGLSNFTLDDLKKYWGLEGKRIFCYYMNKELEKLDNNPTEEKVDQIISIGRFAPNKRFEVIIEALGKIGYKGIYLIIGPSDFGLNAKFKEFYLDLAKKNNVNIDIRAGVDYKHLVKELKRSKLCVVPTIFEGLGHPSFESVHVGTEFLAADIPVKREFHGDTIHYANPDDVNDFAKKIKEILDGKVKMNMEKAQEQIKQFTVENCVDNFIDYLIEEVYNEKPETKSSKSNRYNPK